MTRKRRRLYIVLFGMVLLGAAAALVLSAFEDNIVFFYTPSDLAEKKPSPERRLRVGGVVVENSVKRKPGDAAVSFRLTDMQSTVLVVYEKGILPDMFREGQGIIAEGRLGNDGVFRADEVLAKHDENYMPAEVAEALRASGQWQGQASEEAAQ